MKKIDEWLKEHNYFESFYACKSEKELMGFINTLYDQLTTVT